MTPLSDSEAATVQRFESAEPAPESWSGGLREALAEAIWVNMPDEPYRQDADIAADAVLALPEIAALRAKADAADRVCELLATSPTRHHHVSKLRAALDGPSPC